MAGIYIHIPYCRQACRYCDFHFVVSLWQKKELIPLILREIEERKVYLGNESIETIYFGGGTPSVMEISELDAILGSIYSYYNIAENAEISFEANPEDLSLAYLIELKKLGINRLSIGIQSFQDHDLELMHRIHDSSRAIQSVRDAQQAGFKNISIDLIYGLPRQEEDSWQNNLNIALSLGIQHFSAYHLTYESGTVFDHWRKKGRISSIPEEESLNQFRVLIKMAGKAGFEHYEISNFALKGFESRHNNSYWEQKKYLGIGPSAHSFDTISRRWNFSNNKKYMDGVIAGSEYFETEVLTGDNKYNEYVMTSMRTSKGVCLPKLKELFGEQKAEFFISGIQSFVKSGNVRVENDCYILNEEGIFIADHIIEKTIA